jgi:hypothetical protein
MESLLAGLMDVVPELAEPGEAQRLVGDPASPIIDHENESARQQQQPHKSKKAADHESPSRFLLRRAADLTPWPVVRLSRNGVIENRRETNNIVAGAHCFRSLWPEPPDAPKPRKPGWNGCQPVAGQSRKFNRIKPLTLPQKRSRRPQSFRKALTLLRHASIRAAMAAGAIPPPLFFERRRPIEHLGSGHGILKGIRTTRAASITRLSGRRAYS